MDDYAKAAAVAYDGLKAAYDAETFYWRRGHAFDTAIDYLSYLDDPSEAKSFGTTALDHSMPPPGSWYDDFGWWGMATLRASQLPIFEPLQDRLRQTALAAWTSDDSAPSVWARCKDPWCPQYEPRFEGGTWNHDLPPEEPLQGFQNTVTNCGYLILATRLALLDPNPSGPYLPKSDNQFGFLEQWFSAGAPADPLLYAFQARDTMVVVRERVSAYASDKKVGGYEQARAWAGDQGLLLAGLVDRMRLPAASDLDGTQLALCQNLIVGAITYLVNRTTGALRAWRPDVPGDFTDDYLTGIAVFMRCLLYAYEQNSSLRTFLEQEKFQAFVRTNANLVVASRHSESADPLVNKTNDLATLVAAIRMLQ